MWEYKMNSKGAIYVWMLLMSAAAPGYCEEGPPVTSSTPDCSTDDCKPANSTFTPPPADAMSRLMPTSQVVLSNDTKDPAASNIDIVTTPETSQGLGAYSPFAADRPSADQQNFSPSPFLGVISEAHISNYGQSVAVGEVFPDSVGDRHLGGHKYVYSIAGQRAPHTGHSYHNEQLRSRPTQLSPVDSLEGFGSSGGPERLPTFRTASDTLAPTSETSYPSLTYAPHKDASSLTSSTKSLGYPVFEIPDRFKEFKDVSNAITDYKPPSPVAFPSYDKPIKEDLLEDRPDAFPAGGPGGFGGPDGQFGGFGGPDAFAGSEHPAGPGLPPPPAFMSPPAFYKKPPLGPYGKGGKWGGIFKVLASLIPLGVLLAAFSPSLLVVNATEDPAAPLVEATPSQTQTQSESQTQIQALSHAQMQNQALTQPQLPPHVQIVSQPQLTSGGSAEWTKIPTWSPTVATGKTPYRSLESGLGSERSLESGPESVRSRGSNVTPPQIPAGLQMTSCQKRKVCEALTGVDDSYKSFVDSLVYRVGGGFKEIADLAVAAKCAEIPCTT